MPATMNRTDIHRPVEMDPAAYEYVGAADNAAGDPGARKGIQSEYTYFGVTVTAFSPVGAIRTALETLVARNDPMGRGVYQCHHCGARLRYFAVMLHVPTGEHITVGETCLSGRFSLESKADFDRLRKAAELDRAAQRIKTAAREFVAKLEGDTAIALDREVDFVAHFGLDPNGYAARKIEDYRDKLWNKYGSLFESGTNFVAKLIAENKGQVVRQAQVAAERAAEVKVPAPTGRVTFEGVIVKRVWKDSDFGGAMKLTVKVTTPAGIYLVWVSEPSKVQFERGDTIRMTATLTRSNDNESFAFGKRPSNPVLIERPSEVPEVDSLAD